MGKLQNTHLALGVSNFLGGVELPLPPLWKRGPVLSGGRCPLHLLQQIRVPPSRLQQFWFVSLTFLSLQALRFCLFFMQIDIMGCLRFHWSFSRVCPIYAGKVPFAELFFQARSLTLRSTLSCSFEHFFFFFLLLPCVRPALFTCKSLFTEATAFIYL